MEKTEKELAMWIANNTLDIPFADPDSNISVVSRQLLRALEENNSLRKQLKYKDEEVERLKNDLADALDVKNGTGPTALSILSEQLKQKEEVIRKLRDGLFIAWKYVNEGGDMLMDTEATKAHAEFREASKKILATIEKAKLLSTKEETK